MNELKVCKVSRNPKSKRCWKFQLFMLTNKKVLFLKKNWSLPCTMNSSYFSQKMATWCPNFPHPRLWPFLSWMSYLWRNISFWQLSRMDNTNVTKKCNEERMNVSIGCQKVKNVGSNVASHFSYIIFGYLSPDQGKLLRGIANKIVRILRISICLYRQIVLFSLFSYTQLIRK